MPALQEKGAATRQQHSVVYNIRAIKEILRDVHTLETAVFESAADRGGLYFRLPQLRAAHATHH